MNLGDHYEVLLGEDSNNKYSLENLTSYKRPFLYLFSGVMGVCLIFAVFGSNNPMSADAQAIATFGYGMALDPYTSQWLDTGKAEKKESKKSKKAAKVEEEEEEDEDEAAPAETKKESAYNFLDWGKGLPMTKDLPMMNANSMWMTWMAKMPETATTGASTAETALFSVGGPSSSQWVHLISTLPVSFAEKTT